MLFAGNRSGFEATFAGIKSDEGIYSGISNIAIFWSSSKKAPGLMWYRKLKITEQGVFRHYFSTQNACSVRCIKGK
ncbi:MAG: hypothetical protein U9R19_18820, partial [Bacteroidota bacterium]|nr:hypothetical protein [Bacteroidota bacterium]